MKQNIGTIDRIIRMLAAVVITVLYFTEAITGTLGVVLMVLAAIFFLTSLAGFCPLYPIFGINTCSAKERKTSGA